MDNPTFKVADVIYFIMHFERHRLSTNQAWIQIGKMAYVQLIVVH